MKSCSNVSHIHISAAETDALVASANATLTAANAFLTNEVGPVVLGGTYYITTSNGLRADSKTTAYITTANRLRDYSLSRCLLKVALMYHYGKSFSSILHVLLHISAVLPAAIGLPVVDGK
jgi:hypothetical protein